MRIAPVVGTTLQYTAILQYTAVAATWLELSQVCRTCAYTLIINITIIASNSLESD